MTPCDSTVSLVQVLTVVFTGLSSFLTIWLAHRRKAADRERRKFYWQMRKKHGLPETSEEKAKAENGEFL